MNLHLNRRALLGSLLGAGFTAFGGAARALAPAPDAWQADFDAALARQPWLVAFAGVQGDAEPMALRPEFGRWPRELRGTLVRNGAARFGLAGQRYHHWFDGDGLVQQWRVGEGGMTHRARFVRTPKFVGETQAGQLLVDAFGTHLAAAAPVRSPDQMNVANTSVMVHGGQLYALWEGGSAARLDAETLDFQGFKAWAPDYAGMAFSAHPKIEPRDRSLWNFGISPGAGVLTVYHLGADGQLLKAANLKLPHMPMVHDFAMTERHLVFLLPPLVYETERARAGASFLDAHAWRPELGMRVLVLPKDQLDAPRWLELPAGFVFHTGNAWEERDGRTLHLDCVLSPTADIVQHELRELMRGRVLRGASPARYAQIDIDLSKGRARQQLGLAEVEFPRVDPRLVGQRHAHVVMAERTRRGGASEMFGFDTVTRLNTASGQAQRWTYAPGVMAEEHILVPRDRPGQAWIVGTALDLPRQRMLLSVFDAQHLQDGPIAQASLPRLMPLGLHAIWVPQGQG